MKLENINDAKIIARISLILFVISVVLFLVAFQNLGLEPSFTREGLFPMMILFAVAIQGSIPITIIMMNDISLKEIIKEKKPVK